MPSDPRGVESAAANRRWYLEVSGRRAGPFAWAVLVELAQAGALGADDRVWRMGLASWSRMAELADLAPLMRMPAPARAFIAAAAPGGTEPGRWAIRLLTGLSALLLLVIAGSRSLPNHVPAVQSSAARASRAAAFEARYPFLAELRRVEPSRFDQLDRAVRLGVRRNAPDSQLNGLVAEAAGTMERERLADVDAGSALRLLVELRTDARRFQSSDPAQCVAILRPRSSSSGPVRSAAALAAISPALAALLDAPTGQRGATASQGSVPQRDARDISPKLDCDRLLLMYDTAVASSPETEAAFIRALQGAPGH